jgi:MraZ protein
MFRGCYIHSVDDKSRICLPARLRQSVSEPMMLTKGPEGCLWLLTGGQWQLLLNKAGSSSSIQRFFVAPACECSPGERGRIALPVSLRLHSNIRPGEEVAIVGLGNRIEVWSLARWDAASSQITPQRIREELPEFFE